MDIKIISPKYTNPIYYIANSARICTNNDDFSSDENCIPSCDDCTKALNTCESLLNKGHTTPFESIYIEWLIEGISRACSHQIVRHRCASYLQQSQRYVKYDKGSDFWKNIVMPASISKNKAAIQIYNNLMNNVEEAYLDLIALGIKAEDARYVTTQAHTTTLKIGMNLREFLFNFYPLRSSKHAQAEVSNVANGMMECLADLYHGETLDIFLTKQYPDWLTKQITIRKEWAF